MKSVYLLPIALLCLLPMLSVAETPAMKDMSMAGSSVKPQKSYKGVGIVKSIDSAQSKVTLLHEPIADLQWPAMTMRFLVKDKALLQTLTIGQNVHFEFVKDGSNYRVISAR
jgi:Cu(I)/Ag(I) efflux system protein CusF